MCQVLSEKHMTPKPISVLWRDNAQNSPSSSAASLARLRVLFLTKDTQIKVPAISPGVELRSIPVSLFFMCKMRTWNDVKVGCNESECFSIIDLRNSGNHPIIFSLKEIFIGNADAQRWFFLMFIAWLQIGSSLKSKFHLDYYNAAGNHYGLLEFIFLSICLLDDNKTKN